MNDTPQLTTVRISEDGDLTIPASACEHLDIEPPARVFLETVKDRIRIAPAVNGVRAEEHEPEAAVRRARNTHREAPTFDEMVKSIADQSRYDDEEDVRAFFLGKQPRD